MGEFGLVGKGPDAGPRAGRRKKKPSDQTPEATGLPPIVLIGASAGGLDPIRRFLAAVPVPSGIVFVVVQHLDPHAHSLLVELLATQTKMPVRLAADGLRPLANEIYVIPPGAYLSIKDGSLRLAPATEGIGARMPIDFFLESLAAEQGRRRAAIIMSGSGNDGAVGVAALKHAGGLVVVQDPEEAEHDGMVRAALAAVTPDLVALVGDMPAALLGLLGQQPLLPGATGAVLAAPDAEAAEIALNLGLIIETLRSVTGQSFDRYKPGTLQRRTARRMAINGVARWADYLALIRRDRKECQTLGQDLLINVTEFFRDGPAFEYLGNTLLPAMLSRHAIEEPFRVWVPACSNGEEAYSLGIILQEQMARTGRRPRVQIFATDIDDTVLQVAREGVYPETIRNQVSEERLAQFFIHANGRYKVVPELRSCVMFSHHDLLEDPPFSRLDMISCRNLFIYLQTEAQRRLLHLFHYGLREGGLLMLGAAESLGDGKEIFEPLDAQLRFFQRRGGRSLPGYRYGHFGQMSHRNSLDAANIAAPVSLADLVQREVLVCFAPAVVVTNNAFEALYFFGPIDRYLRVGQGEPKHDILAMARENLRPALRDLVGHAHRGTKGSYTRRVQFKRGDRAATVTVAVRQLGDAGQDLLLVSFTEEVLDAVARPAEGKEGSVVEALRRELADTRNELNRSINDLQRTNEEMRSAHEEALTLNEELLSANEELETSKEELQSLNEELATVNTQLRQTLEQQRRASTDLANVLNSSGVATIFLDDKVRIKTFNGKIQSFYAVIDSDIGRPLADLVQKFADPDLIVDAGKAFSTGEAQAREIAASNGNWYLRTVQPYRSETGAIEGTVVTFADVSRLKHAELEAAAARRYAETVIDTVSEPLLAIDSNFKVEIANTAFCQTFGHEVVALIGRNLRDFEAPMFAEPKLWDLVVRVFSRRERSSALESVEIETITADEKVVVWRVAARSFHVAPLERSMVLLSLVDVTDRTHVIESQLQMLMDSTPDAAVIVDRNRRIRYASKRIETLLGYGSDELIGALVDELIPATSRDRHIGLHTSFLAAASNRTMNPGLEIHALTKAGQEIPVTIGLSPVATTGGMMIFTTIHDLTAQKESERSLREAKTAADLATQVKTRFLSAASHDLRQPLQTIGLLLGALGARTLDPQGRMILGKLDDTVANMSEVLDMLFDINQIEGGQITAEVTEFPLASLLDRIRDEFDPIAKAKGLDLRLVPTWAVVCSDQRLLRRIIANLVSNAIKYTDAGSVLVGCRFQGDALRIEVWDTGVGIASAELDAVFDEFYRVDRSDSAKFGLGLGLSIVRRFAGLLDHAVEVKSRPGKGTTFSVTVPRAGGTGLTVSGITNRSRRKEAAPTILLIEDDPAQLEALRILLDLEGFGIAAARHGEEALRLLSATPAVNPDLVIADYNLPGGMNGLEVIDRARIALRRAVPALIVSGDRSTAVVRAIADKGETLITKPVKPAGLLAAVAKIMRSVRPDWSERSRPEAAAPWAPADATAAADIGVIDDEPAVRESTRMMLESAGHKVATYASGEALLADPERSRFRCLIVDLTMPGISGLDLQKQLKQENSGAAIIFVTGSNHLPLALAAIRAGAIDFLQKPVRAETLLDSVARALESDTEDASSRIERETIATRIATLTTRERQVMDRILLGEPSKIIAADLGISQRTTEHHRHNVMRKMAAKSLPALIRMVGRSGPGER